MTTPHHHLDVLGLFALDRPLEVVDIGAAVINDETPPYAPLLQAGLAHLTVFDGDIRHAQRIRERWGAQATVRDEVLFDGTPQRLRLAAPESGMTSLLEPEPNALAFFNGFTNFGSIDRTIDVPTRRLDDLELAAPDLLKLDIQGAELTVLRHGIQKLASTLMIQVEVSFIPLYLGQPPVGEVDTWLRAQGFSPHALVELKRWSIAPTIFNNSIRVPGNQLLEGDLVYVRDPLRCDLLGTRALERLFTLAHFYTRSVDLCIFLLRALEARGALPPDAHLAYLAAPWTRSPRPPRPIT